MKFIFVWLVFASVICHWTNGQNDCQRYRYNTYVGRDLYRSSFSVEGLTLQGCMEFCDTMGWCGGIQYDSIQQLCHIHRQIGFVVKDHCCIIARKYCIDEPKNSIDAFAPPEKEIQAPIFPTFPTFDFSQPIGRQAELDQSLFKGETTPVLRPMTPRTTTPSFHYWRFSQTTTAQPDPETAGTASRRPTTTPVSNTPTTPVFHTPTTPVTREQTSTPVSTTTAQTIPTSTTPVTRSRTTAATVPNTTPPEMMTTSAPVMPTTSRAAITLAPADQGLPSTFNLTDYLEGADPEVIALIYAYFGGRTPHPPMMSPEGREADMDATTLPPFLHSLVPDSGVCPDPMEKATGVYVPGGRLVPSASTPEDCKLYCMMDAACEAVDFHNSLSKCISHDANDMQDYERLPNPLHDHYHKTHCEERRCYSHAAIDMTSTNIDDLEDINQLSLPDGVELVPCDGICFVSESLSLTEEATQLGGRTLVRGCMADVSLAEGQRCEVQQSINGGAEFELHCRCDTDRCNALGPSPAYSLALYLPLDGDLLDHSGKLRHGQGRRVQYDAWAASKGSAAYLDGTADIVVPSLGGYLPGVLTHFERLSSFTLTFWFKRLDSAVDKMTLLSTGMVEVTSTLSPDDEQTVSFSAILSNNMGYIVRAQAPLSEWLFVACRIIYAGTEEETELQLFVHPANDTVDIPLATVTTPALPVQLGMFTVHIGRHPLRNSHFTGFIDEVMIYEDALTETQLQSIYDLTRKYEEPMNGSQSTTTTTAASL